MKRIYNIVTNSAKDAEDLVAALKKDVLRGNESISFAIYNNEIFVLVYEEYVQNVNDFILLLGYIYNLTSEFLHVRNLIHKNNM